MNPRQLSPSLVTLLTARMLARVRLPPIQLGLALLVGAARALGANATFEERVELFFRAPLAEQMALSPSGGHVAYTRYEGDDLQVILLNVSDPRRKFTLNVDEARAVAFSAERKRAPLRFLRWATPNRIVVAPAEDRIAFPGQPPRIVGPIFAVNADGQNPMTLCDADDFSVEREMPFFDAEGPPPPPAVRDPRPPQIVGFEPANREELILRLPGLNPPIGARDRRIVPPEMISLNVLTGKITELNSNQVRGANDGRLPATPALRREVAGELAKKFPLRNVAILDWSERMENVLARVTGGSDPGRVFVYQRQYNMVLEVFRTAPWLTAKNLNESRVVEFEPSPGVKLSGHFTSPRTPRLKPPPLLVSFPDGFPGRTQADFDPEAQAFADLGFAVLRLNHRYDRGLPTGERELARTAIDRISVDDAAATIQKVAALFPDRPFDAKHVAALGRGFGGYLAVRALQLRPEVFRAGIAIDAPMDLRAWFNPVEGAPPRDIPRDLLTGSDVPWARLSVRENVESLTRPVFFLVEPARNAEVERSVDAIRSAQKTKKRTAEVLELDPAFNNAQPKTRAAVYRKIEEFLNLWLYDYKVRIGPAQEVK